MSYSKEDHFPPPDRKCIICGERFVPECWWKGACPECDEDMERYANEEEELDEDRA